MRSVPSYKNRLLEGPILRSLLRLALPIVATNVLQSAYQIIDAFWVGRLGGAAVAAVSISFPVMFLMFAVGAGLSIAGSTLIAQYVGARNEKMVSHVAGQTILMVVASALVLTVIGWFFSPLLLRLMGVTPDVYDGALGFMRVQFLALAFNFVFFVFQAIMRSIGRAHVPVFIVLGTVIGNFALNPLLIFGWGPVPAFGVMGAAIVTFITQAMASIVGLIILRGGRRGIHVHWADFVPDMKHIKRAFRLGLPASIEMSSRAFGFMLLAFLVASFGTQTLASYGVGSNVFQVVIIQAVGLSMSVAALAGQNIGAGNIDRAAAIGRLGSMLGFGVLTCFGLLGFFFAHQLVAFFVPRDQGVIEEGARYLRIMALSWGFLGIQFAVSGMFRASGNLVMNMVLTIVSLWVIQLPLAYILAKHTSLGADGIYWSVPITNVLTATIMAAAFLHGGWRKKRLISRH
ncbi:MAG TPA: MATE family efflux transporter [Reyranella sp.]|nr:MATE family efflux transporter [Reyranella sp.]